MDVSIIIISYNTIDLLRNCLASVRKQTQGIAYEVFVVDNASTDGSPEMVEREFPEVRLIRNRDNHGFAKANNQAIALAEGEYVLLLNSDTVLENNAVAILHEFMRTHPRAGACGPLLLNTDGTVQKSLSRIPTPYSLLHSMVFGSLTQDEIQDGYSPTRFDYTTTTELRSAYVTGACLMMPRATLTQIGLLDENYFFAMEEVDWELSALRNGWELWFVPDAVVTHVRGASNPGERHTEKEIHAKRRRLRQQLYYVLKNYGLPWYLAFRGVTILLNVGNVIRWHLFVRARDPLRLNHVKFRRTLALQMLKVSLERGHSRGFMAYEDRR